MNSEMTAYDAFIAVLDINETIEELKKRNTDNQPDLVNCKAVDLLVQYRQVLERVMKKTILGVFEDDN